MIDILEFKKTLGQFTTGVCVATTQNNEGKSQGVTINAFSSVSLKPPLILFCLSKTSKAAPCFLNAPHFAINILGADQQLFSVRFSSHAQDKWRGIPHTLSDLTQCPLLASCVGYIECRRHAVYEGGDHWIILGEVIRLKTTQNRPPLVYHNGQYTKLES